MEQFSLEKYLENPSRKITTRYGDREVRIICTDRKGKRPIVALMVDMDDGSEYITSHSINGWIDDEEKYPDKRDLFFADEEKLTEFEKLMIQFSHERDSLIKYGNDSSVNRCTHRYSNQLLDLARKEVEKDLPKYKKAKKDEVLDWVVKFDKNDNIILSDVVYKGEYFITLQSLKILPKEE